MDARKKTTEDEGEDSRKWSDAASGRVRDFLPRVLDKSRRNRVAFWVKYTLPGKGLRTEVGDYRGKPSRREGADIIES